MALPKPKRLGQVTADPVAIDEDLLNGQYAQLAPTFDDEIANAERRAARDIYARHTPTSN